MNWKDKRVLVTGGLGFLGSHLVEQLKGLGCNPLIPSHEEFDLRFPEDVSAMMREAGEIDILFNLAANVGGIGYNQNHPYNLFYDNASLGINMIHAAVMGKVKKFVQLGTICSYPKFCKPPFREEMIWDGYPEGTNAPYGLAKKMLLVQLQAAREEYGFNGIYIIPTNLYGPRDEFSPHRSHVIPALINKCFESKKNGVNMIKVWGSGNASRDFLFAPDAAAGIIMAAEKYDNGWPLNLGSEREVRIAYLAHKIAELCQFEGAIEWDTSKPDGQPRRGVDYSSAKHSIGWEPATKLEDGLQMTIDWYKDHINA